MANNTPKFDVNDIREQTRKISSLSSSVKKLEDSELRRVSDRKDINRLMSTTSKIIAKLGLAVGAVTTGIKTTTVGATKYTQEAIKQYGEALKQDVDIDKGKLSVLATRTGPVMGFFITKFFDTPAFKNTMNTIKNKVASTMSVAGQKFKNVIVSGAEAIKNSFSSVLRGIGNFFRRITGRKPKETPMKKLKSETRHGVFAEKEGEIKYYPTSGRKRMGEIPKLQKGGVIGRSGLAHVHSAEVVMPIRKLMAYQLRIQKQMQEGVIEGFEKSQEKTYDEYNKPFYKKFLVGLSEIKYAISRDPTNIVYRMREMWINFLDRHPVFMGLYKFSKLMIKMTLAPFKWLFSSRTGKWNRYVSRDSNPLVAMSQTIGAFYPLMMWKYNQIVELLKLQVEATRSISDKKHGKLRLPKMYKKSRFSILTRGVIKLLKYVGRKAEGIMEKERVKRRTPERIKKRILEQVAKRVAKEKKKGKSPIEIKRIAKEEMRTRLLRERRRARNYMTIRKRFKSFLTRQFRKIVNGIGSVMKQAGKFTWRFIKPFINAKTLLIIGGIILIRKALTKWAEPIAKGLKFMWDWNRQFLRDLLNFKDLMKNTMKFWGDKITRLYNFGKNLFDKFNKWANALNNEIRKWAKQLPASIWNYFKKLTVAKAIDNISSGVKSLPSKITDPIISISKKILGAVDNLLSPLEGILGFLAKILFPAKFREEMGKILSERGEIEKRTKETMNIAEIRLLRSIQKKHRLGNISDEAFRALTEGGPEGIGDRLAKLKADKKIVEIGPKMMLANQQYTSYGLRAMAEEKYKETKPKVKEEFEKRKKQLSDITQEIKSQAGPRYEETLMFAKKKKKEFIESPTIQNMLDEISLMKMTPGYGRIMDFTEEQKKRFIEKKAGFQEISKPVIGKADLIRLQSTTKAKELMAQMRSSEEFKKGMEDMKKFQGMMINNFNNATNIITETVSNTMGGNQQGRLESGNMGLDPVLSKIWEGGLD